MDMQKKRMCYIVFLFLLSTCAPEEEVHPFTNGTDNSHIYSVKAPQVFQPLIEQNEDGSYTVSVSLPSPGLAFPGASTRTLSGKAEINVLYLQSVQQRTLRLPATQIVHGTLLYPENTRVRISNSEFRIWEGSNEPFPYLQKGNYSVKILEISNLTTNSPAALIGYSSGSRYVEYLWIMRDGFAYPVAQIRRAKKLDFHLPPLRGRYILFSSSDFLVNSYIRPDTVRGVSSEFMLDEGENPKIMVELFWLRPIDMDLHILPYGNMPSGGAYDCYFGNTQTSWGCQFLNINDAGFGENRGGRGFGSPEVAVLNNTVDGWYVIVADVYNMRDAVWDICFVSLKHQHGQTVIFSPVTANQTITMAKFHVKNGHIVEIIPLNSITEE